METNEEANALLAKAFEERDLDAFKVALENGADPYRRIKNENFAIFHKALQSHGCVEFVKACSSRKELLRNDELLKYITNFASASRDPQILSHILNILGFQNRVSTTILYCNLTPLNSLIKDITTENFDDTFKCIKLLIEYEADPNEPDDLGIKPIVNIIQDKKLDEERKKEIIQYLVNLDDPRVDIDIFTPGQDITRTLIRNNFPDIQFYNVAQVDINWECFSELGEKKQEETFIKSIEEFESCLSKLKEPFTLKEETYQTLLEITMRNGLLQAFTLLTQSDNVTYLDYTHAIAFSCCRGYSKPLDILLNSSHINLNVLNGEKYLKILLFHWNTIDEINNYKECLNILLSSPLIQFRKQFWKGINGYFSKRNEEAFITLLDKGLCKIDSVLIKHFDPKALEKHFDNCITAPNAEITEEYYVICINYSSLLANNSCDKECKERKENEESEESEDIESIFKLDCVKGKKCNEGKPIFIIKQMADSKNKRHLLGHPFLTSFLFLKWRTLSSYFYVNFLCSLLFCIFLVSYIISDFNNTLNGAGRIMLLFFIVVGLSYIITREIIQAITLKIEMFNTFLVGFSNVIEILLIIFTILTICYSAYKDEPGRSFAVVTILLACVEVYLLVGSLPVLNLSTHMLMLNAVCVSFIKSFSQYFMFFVTFGLCFHMVFSKAENSTPSEDSSKDSDYFNSAWYSIFKSFIMVTGEFDSGNIYFNSPISYGILLIFVAFMSIVLLNLLTGLAVSDIQMIIEKAELNGYISSTYQLAKLEKSITFFKTNRVFKSICGKLINSFIKHVRDEEDIMIYPNRDNKILTQWSFTNADLENIDQYTRPMFRCLVPIFSWLCGSSFNRKFFRIDGKIVEAAQDIVIKNQNSQTKENIAAEQKIRTNQIMNKIEKQLENIEGNVQSRFANTETKVDTLENRLKNIEINITNIQYNMKKLVMFLKNPSPNRRKKP